MKRLRVFTVIFILVAVFIGLYKLGGIKHWEQHMHDMYIVACVIFFVPLYMLLNMNFENQDPETK